MTAAKLPFERALVTGASSGIGRVFATILAGHGVDLVVVARREDILVCLADQLRAEHGVEIEVLVADLTEDKQLTMVEERLADGERPVDLLVNNAGAGKAGLFAELPVAGELATVALDVIAPVRLMHAALRRMRTVGRGAVINISSMTGAMPMPRSATYGASKAFLTALSESVHVELTSSGIQVMSVEAGLTRTGFHDAAGIDVTSLPRIAWSEPERVVNSALRALGKGKVRTVPGAMNRMLGAFMGLVPRPLLRRMVDRMFGA